MEGLRPFFQFYIFYSLFYICLISSPESPLPFQLS
jgi:hypothetical protein